MSVYYKINDVRIPLGPTNIVDTPPESGIFNPSRGKAITFATVYVDSLSEIINREEKWEWDLVIEDSATYSILKNLSYSGHVYKFETSYGLTNSGKTYSGEVKDIVFELKDGLTFNGGKKGYKVTMPVNCW